MSVSINRDITSVFVSIYQSRYNLCIRQYLSIEIQPLFTSVSINRDTTSLFISIYQSRYCISQYLSIEIQHLYSSVSFNRNTTSVFVSIYQSRYNQCYLRSIFQLTNFFKHKFTIYTLYKFK